MRGKRAAQTLCAIFFICFGIGAAGFHPAWGQETPPPEYSRKDVQDVINVLEDPAAREKLIQQLTILSQARTEQQAEKEAPTAPVRLLQAISERMESTADALMTVVGTIDRLPQGMAWAKRQGRLPENRAFWIEVLINVGIVVLLGYGIFYLSRRLFRRPRRKLAEAADCPVWSRIGRLSGRFLLDLAPLVIFTLGVYAALGVLAPLEKARLVVLAWTHAFLAHRLIIMAARAVFAARAPHLRLSRISDETARNLEKWTQRFSGLIIYGYAALQAALLLGMEIALYDGLLRLLGLLVVVMAIVFVLRNRKRAGDCLRNLDQRRRNEKQPYLRRALDPLARLWHVPAILLILLIYGVWALKMPGGAVFLLKGIALTLLAVAIGVAILRRLHPFFHKRIRVSDDAKAAFYGTEPRIRKYMAWIYKVIRLVIIALVLLAVLQSWGVDAFGRLAGGTGRQLLETLLRVMGVLALALIVWEAASAYIEKYLHAKTEDGVTQAYSARTRTLMSVMRKALLITVVVIATLTVLSELGVDIAPLLAGAGVLGLAIGFGAQKLVQDVITGIFILLEDQVSEGDVVSVGGKAGLVESVDIRTLRLRDLSGTVHTLPYSAIDSVSNLTKGFSFYIFDVGVAYREDVDEVMNVLQEIGADLQKDPEYGPVILEPLEMLGVDAFADSAVVIKARIKTVPIKQWYVGREFNRRMKKRFDDLDIEIPFPHQTLYFGVDKEQNAPPARVRILSKGNQAVAEDAEEHAGRRPKTVDPGLPDEAEDGENIG